MKGQGNNRRTQLTRRGLFFLKKAITICAISLLCLFLAPPAGAATVNATADVNLNTLYQQIEGFGASGCYEMQTLANHPYKETIYNLLFRDLGLDLLRIKNTYQINSGDVNATAQIVAAGKSRNPALKTLLVPWSPKASLKSDGYLGGSGHYYGTLKKDANDSNNSSPYYYVYNEYAKWWLNSLTASDGFFSQGVYPDYISIQNEPDWGEQDQECMFDSTENSTHAGYDKAFKAVYNKIDGNVSPMPKMLAPETMGFGGSQTYIDALVNISQINHIYGFSHHLYSDGDGNYYYPDDMIPGMQSYKTNYGDYYNKPLFQTEYAALEVPSFHEAMFTAQHIHNCLVYEGATSYFYWSLFRGWGGGGMVNIEYGTYNVRDIYWFFKHYAFFTDPGWFRAKTTTTSSDLRITAFRNITDVNTAIVILNKSATNDVNLTLSLTGFVSQATWLKNEMYRSTSTSSWASLGQFNPNQALLIPAQSITTIHLATFQTCAEVQAAGYWLTSDITGITGITGDCYVDYFDLKVIADNWLRQDCNESNNWCDWADLPWTAPDGKIDFLDFSTFAPLWMRCNNPEDPNCRSSW